MKTDDTIARRTRMDMYRRCVLSDLVPPRKPWFNTEQDAEELKRQWEGAIDEKLKDPY